MTERDKLKFDELIKSLNSSAYDVQHKPNHRQTESLYRFGWFIINDHIYSISEWSFIKGHVTFESENGYKVKYSIPNKITIDGDFKKNSFIEKITRKVRIKLSTWLKDLSDKLHP